MVEQTRKNKALDIYPLSPLQEGMLFHHLYHRDAGDHITQGMLPLAGTIDATLLESAFQKLVDRHDVLRTVFLNEDLKKPRQVVVETRRARVRFIDLAASNAPHWETKYLTSTESSISCCCASSETDAVVTSIADYDHAQGFDLRKDLLVRMTLIKLGAESYKLVITNHHIILDGWSLSILLEELIEFYWAAKTGKSPDLKPAIQFKQYIKWIAESDFDAGYTYFSNMLEDFGSPTSIPRQDWYFPSEYKTVATQTYTGYDFNFGQDKTAALEDFCRAQQLTLNTAIQGLWALVLKCFSNRDDVVFGNVVSGRSADIRGVDAMVGMTINTLPLRIRLADETIFSSLLKAIQNNSKMLEKYSYLQLAEIQRSVRSNELLFEHTLAFENYPISEELFAGKYADIGFTIPLRQGRDFTSYDLDVTFFPGPSLVLNLWYNTSLYSTATIKSIAHTLDYLITQLIANPNLTCGDFLWTDASPAGDREVTAISPALHTWIQTFPVNKSNTAISVQDGKGRTLPVGALGILHVSREKNNPDHLPVNAIQVAEKHIHLVGHHQRSISQNSLVFSPELVEAVALNECGIANCALVATDDQTQLIFWLQAQENVDTEKLIETLKYKLSSLFPRFMLPVQYMLAGELTVTADRVSVVALQTHENKVEQTEKAFADIIETQMGALWKEILGVDSVNANDDFFLKGGHSLMAMRFSSRAKKLFKHPPTTMDVFSIRTFSGLVEKVRRDEASGTPSARSDYSNIAMQIANTKTWYKTSSQQQRLYSLQALAPESLAYNMPDAFILRGPIDVERLSQAFELSVAKHEALRTSFHLQDDSIVQKIHAKSYFKLAIEKMNTDISVSTLLNAFIRPFRLDVPNLVRARLCVQSETQAILLIDMHHIVTDGVSIDILVEDLVNAYHQQALSPARFQYKDYCEWQQLPHVRELLESQKQYWLQTFNGEIPVLALPTDFTRKPEFAYTADQFQAELGVERSKRIRTFCQDHKVTPYMFFMAVYQVLLARYSNQQEIVVGTPIAGRNHQDVEDIVGMFVNTLAIKQSLDFEQTFSTFLASVRDTMLGAFNHQNLPLEELITVLNPPRDLSRNPLFDVLFVLEDKKQPLPQFDNLSFELVDHSNRAAKVDLLLAILDDPENYSVHIEYAAELFSGKTIMRMGDHFHAIVDSVLTNSESKLGEIEILSATEIAQLLDGFNPAPSSVGEFNSIAAAFENTVRKHANLPAVRFRDDTLSFEQLNIRANCFAQWLLVREVKPGDVVALMMTKSIDMIVAIYGVLKAGAAYVPIGADYPRARIDSILQDLDSGLLVYNSELNATLAGLALDCHAICFDTVLEESESLPEAINNPETNVSGNDLAYVIYTSGSTGKPKGIMIEQRSILNLALYFKNIFGPGDHVTQFAPFTFDASAGEILTTILNGACLHVLPNDIIGDPAKYADYLKDNEITFTALPPPYLVNVDFSGAKKLHTLLAAGSSSNVDVIQTLRKQLTYINAYGPTETTVISTEWHSERDPLLKNCIGRPIVNTTVYILNEQGKLQPPGVEGEICIGGMGVARGYVRDAEKTASQFIVNPYRTSEIVYRTGDLGKLTENGDIIFLGRKDDQVKIRGFRIEIAEVEHHVKSLPLIDDAHVMAFEDVSGNLALCCYFTSSSLTHTQADLEKLRQELRKCMPEYMIPVWLVCLQTLPLTANGKVDRKQLPPPEQSGPAQEIVAPRTPVESLLIDTWQAVLGNKNIGITDNFFSLGGDSIKAIQIAARLNAMGFKLETGRVFQHPRIQDLAGFVQKNTLVIEQGAVSGLQMLTPIQHWFFRKNFSDAHHWNQATVLYSAQGFDRERVLLTLNTLLEHHDNLRAVPADGSMYVASELAYNTDLPTTHIRSGSIELALADFGNIIQSSIDLTRGPLLRAGILLGEEGGYLVIAIHHLLVDGVSWRILYDDFCNIYQALEQGHQVALPPKTHSFKQWAEGLLSYAKSPALFKQYRYWSEVCRKDCLIQLSSTQAKGQPKLIDAKQIAIDFDEETTRRLQEQAPLAFNTNANDLLLTALSRAIGKVCGSGDFLINLEGHGREDLCPGLDISRTVGWFTSAYPVRLTADTQLHNQAEIKNAIVRTKEILHNIPDNGIGYGVLSYLSSEEQRSSGKTNIGSTALACDPEISFNFLGDFSFDEENGDISISGLNAGAEMSPNGEALCALNINGAIFQGKLGFDFEYIPQLLSAELVSALVKAFQEQLIEVINFCCLQKHTFHTPSDFSASGLTLMDLTTLSSTWSAESIEDIHNLTPLQEGMLYTCLLNTGRGDYNIQNDIVLRGELDHAKLAVAFKQISVRHQALRTAIAHENLSQPLQVILKERDIPFCFFNISDLDVQAQQKYIEDLQQEDWLRGFDLAKDSLTRVVLLRTGKHEHRMLMLSHHIMMDGWCVGAVFGELLEIYRAAVEGETPRLDSASDYSAYLDWLQKQDKDASLDYWKQALAGFESHGGLPFIASNTKAEYRLRDDTLIISAQKTSQLNKLAAENGLTLNSITQAIWALLLAGYSNTDDVVFANVISGRPAELVNADKTIGLFVNTIPLRVRLTPAQNFLDLAAGIQLQFKEAEANGYLGLAEIRDQATLPASVFDHVFVFENFPVGQFESESPVPGLTIEPRIGKEQVNYDFNIILAPGEQFSIRFSHNEHAISANQVDRIKAHFAKVIDQVLADIHARCSALSLLTDADRAAWDKLNDTRVDYNLEQSLLDIISRQVQHSPDATAVVYEDVKVSYSQLWQASGMLAVHLLSACGVQRGAVVALALKRSQHMLTGVMGILRAASAWLPIDPDLPIERIRYMLETANCQVIVTDNKSSLPAEIQQSNFNIVEISEWQSVADKAFALPDATSKDLAYVLYTSGSTGNPKGVMIEHQAIVNRLLWMIDEFQFGPRDVFLQKTAFTFDVSVFELIVPFMCGASLVLLRPGEERVPALIAETVSRENVSVIHFVPSMLSGFLDAFDGEIPMESLRLCVCSGEALTVSHKDRFYAQMPHTLLSNLYGPTEAAIDVTWQNVEKASVHISIGTPVANTHCYVLDSLGRICPVGVTGELHLAGVQLARGYINNPTLTVERFIHSEELGERLYRTGDLAMLAEDGRIHYLGRSDFQVKVRGFRIELGEIENVLSRLDAVKDVLVSAFKLGDETTALCAYFTAHHEISEDNVKSHLQQRLPEYMVPAFVIRLDAFPLNTSGKVDRKKLPNPVEKITDGVGQRSFSELELIIERVWRQVLLPNQSTANELLPVDSRFEQLGGHSINAIRVCALISRDTGVALVVADLYRHPTIRELALHMGNLKQLQARSGNAFAAEKTSCLDEVTCEQLVNTSLEQWQNFEQGLLAQFTKENSRVFALSPIQALHIQQTNRLSGGVVEFEYCPDSEKLASAVRVLVSEQALLLAHYEPDAVTGGWQWRCLESANFPPVPFVDLSQYEEHSGRQFIDKLINQTTEKLLEQFVSYSPSTLAYSLFLVKLPKGRHLLLFGADHLITDGSSLEIIRSEVTRHYLGLTQGKEQQRPTINKNTYEAYVRKVRSGPQVAAREYQALLADFLEQQTTWLRFYDNHHIAETRRITFSTQVDPALQSQAEAALTTFTEFVWALTDFNKLPLTFVADQRKYAEADYFHVIGEFLDHVPVLYTRDASAKTWLSETRSFIAKTVKENVNFLALAENSSAFGEWRTLAEQLYANDAHLKLIRFNYQGEEGSSPVSDNRIYDGHDEFALKGILCDVSSNGERLNFTIETNISTSTDFLENFIDYQQYESLTK